MLAKNMLGYKQIDVLPLFAWAAKVKEQKLNKTYAEIFLQAQFGFSDSKASLIAELAGLNSNYWRA
jgi:hypothetical protein